MLNGTEVVDGRQWCDLVKVGGPWAVAHMLFLNIKQRIRLEIHRLLDDIPVPF